MDEDGVAAGAVQGVVRGPGGCLSRAMMMVVSGYVALGLAGAGALARGSLPTHVAAGASGGSAEEVHRGCS